MDDLTFASASVLTKAITERRVSSVEVVEAHVRQIAEHNAALNAVITIDETGALEKAREADATLARGESWGPLHGLPVTLKDVHHTAGMRSTLGHPDYANHIPSEDSAMPARLKRAGAILLGKTNVDLFPENPFGRTRNPWDLVRTPGGSSSGAVAAVAAGLSPLDIGSDALGSNLCPAHFCGVFSMRPTEHRVSLSAMVWMEPAFLWHSVMVFGPVTRSAQDLDLVMRVIAGPEGSDFNVPPLPWRDPPKLDLRDLRIAWSPLPDVPIATEIRSAVGSLAGDLASRGAWVEERLPPVDLREQGQLGLTLSGQLINAFPSPSSGEPPVTLGDHLLALDRRSDVIAIWEDFFTGWDALLCPVYATTAPRDDERDAALMVDGAEVMHEESYIPTRLSPATGHPAVVIPAARDRHGLPFGVQLIGPRWEDERLIAIAGLVASLTGGYQRPPGF